MNFLRALWIRSTNPLFFAAPPRVFEWSFLFRVLVLAAFLVTATAVSGIISDVRGLLDNVSKLPAGVIMTKKGDLAVVSGVAQPVTYGFGNTVVTLDTTGALSARPPTSTVFISARALEILPAGATAPQTIFWKDEPDFTYKLDDIKTFLPARENLLVIGLVIATFLAAFISQVIWAGVMVLVVGVVTWGMWKILRRRLELPMYDMWVVVVRSLVGPIVLWVLLTVAGVPIAGVVETILFVVYSSIALRPILYAADKVGKNKQGQSKNKE